MQLLAIARGLDPSRWRAVCVLPERGELAPLLEEAGAQVEIRPLAVLRRTALSPAGLLRLARAAWRDAGGLATLAREHDAALIHSNTSAVLAGSAAARRAGVPHIMHVREIYAGAAGRAGALLWPLARRRLRRAHALACISEAVRSQFAGAPNARLVCDGLPRDPQPPSRGAARAALGIPEEPFVAAVIGRVSDWKGQDVLARALAEPQLADIGALGLVAGDEVPGSGAAAELDALAQRLGVSERVRLLGFRRDVDTVLGAADALCVPSTRPEPLGLVALEGAAAGLPVVASAHGGVMEAVLDGETGLLVPPGNAAALAGALRWLADDPQSAGSMGAAGARLMAERFSRERMLAELQDLYEELLAGLSISAGPL